MTSTVSKLELAADGLKGPLFRAPAAVDIKKLTIEPEVNPLPVRLKLPPTKTGEDTEATKGPVAAGPRVPARRGWSALPGDAGDRATRTATGAISAIRIDAKNLPIEWFTDIRILVNRFLSGEKRQNGHQDQPPLLHSYVNSLWVKS